MLHYQYYQVLSILNIGLCLEGLSLQLLFLLENHISGTVVKALLGIYISNSVGSPF